VAAIPEGEAVGFNRLSDELVHDVIKAVRLLAPHGNGHTPLPEFP
jgi:hypothetical protein